MFGSSLWDGCGVLHEGNQLLFSSGLILRQVPCWDHQRTPCGGLDGKNPEKAWYFLKVNFTKYLKIAYVGHGIRSNILWMELKASKDIPEIF